MSIVVYTTTINRTVAYKNMCKKCLIHCTQIIIKKPKTITVKIKTLSAAGERRK